MARPKQPALDERGNQTDNPLYTKGEMVPVKNKKGKVIRHEQRIEKNPLHFTTRAQLIKARRKFEKQLEAGYTGARTEDEIKEQIAYIDKALKSKELGKGLE